MKTPRGAKPDGHFSGADCGVGRFPGIVGRAFMPTAIPESSAGECNTATVQGSIESEVALSGTGRQGADDPAAVVRFDPQRVEVV
jgi:hypothetical protein